MSDYTQMRLEAAQEDYEDALVDYLAAEIKLDARRDALRYWEGRINERGNLYGD